MISGIVYSSIWFGTFAVYYTLLAVMRFALIHYVRKYDPEEKERRLELRRCRYCGITLLFLNFALTGIVIQTTRSNSSAVYSGSLIFLMAMYSFWAIITASINMVKYRKYGSPVLYTAKIISMTTAMVSVFSLQTAMLTQFSSGDEDAFRLLMNAITGTIVVTIVMTMAVLLIIYTTRAIRKDKKEESSNG